MLMLKLAVIFASIVVPIQIFIGDQHGLNTEEHQPAKIAALEAHWESRAGAPLVLLAIPDEEAERNSFELAIPKLGSLILKHDFDASVTGLKEFARADRPPVGVIFYSFRLMVGIGLLMLAVAWTGLVQLARGKLAESRWLLRVLPWMIPSGFVALLAGWCTTEVGRQPYVIYGLMRTADAGSPVPGASVAVTLALFIAVYGGVFGAGIYYLTRVVKTGPLEVDAIPADTRAARPFSAAAEPIDSPSARPERTP